ncbi:MAG: tetratricopeptide repeat protein [Phyllobacteriaceae bacterium]|jgi:lipoprotein NlpI|nr:tetratricopeptide repeat protein [Phyllobacteriaceae bacterium]
MKVRRVSFAFVSAAFLAAFATNGSSALANSSSAQVKLTRDAYQSLQSGDADAAIASYTKAIKSRALEPEVLANALLNRALAYQQKAADEQAIADYTQALALDAMAPALRATALYNRGLSRQKTGNLPSAVEDFTAALLLNPEFAHAYYSRANALRDSGQMLFALSDYERALRFKHPDTTKVNYGIAVTYVALRRPADARKALAAVLEANPEHAAARDQLAKLGNAESAAIDESEADLMPTGSIVAITGGTSAKKSVLPPAVDVPSNMQTAMASPAKVKAKAKKFTDRVPFVENANFEPGAEPQILDSSKGVAIEEVPAIPAPEKKKKTAAVELPVEEQVAPAAEPAEQLETATATQDQPSGYAVQIASAASEDAAWSTWKKMQARNKALQGLKPNVIKADLGTKGVFYRVRLHGFEDQSGAKAVCSKLKSSGVSCFVSKT